MNKMPQTTKPAKRTFQWGISSTDIPFTPGCEVAGVREGSVQNCNDCSSYVSPLPRPKGETPEPHQEAK